MYSQPFAKTASTGLADQIAAFYNRAVLSTPLKQVKTVWRLRSLHLNLGTTKMAVKIHSSVVWPLCLALFFEQRVSPLRLGLSDFMTHMPFVCEFGSGSRPTVKSPTCADSLTHS